MSLVINAIHERIVFSRRMIVLARHLCDLLPRRASVLDVGCGDGTIDKVVETARPDISIHGVDVLVRPSAKISVQHFDGITLPFPDRSFDVVTFVDVLHHTDDPNVLLREAARVGRRAIVLKDHTMEGFCAYSTLRFMDWVGNARHGVVLPYNYWPEDRWRESFAALKLEVSEWRAALGLYPWPASILFERTLHFVALLRPIQ